MRNYSFRRLTRADLPRMRQWLATPHVKTWWPDAEQQATMMKQDIDNPDIDMQVVSLNDYPFAYVHDHDASRFGLTEFADLPPGTRVLATFVGDSAFMGQGHSAGYIAARVRALRLRYRLVAVGPNTTDTRAVRIFTQAGFMKRRLAPTRDGRLVQVMTHL